MQTTIVLVTDANAPVEYIDGVTEELSPLTDAELNALPAGTRNVRKASEPTDDLAGWLVIRKARPRKVRFHGKGQKIVTAANGEKIVTPVRAVTVTAARAASVLDLNAAESATFGSRFLASGAAAPAPKDTSAVEAVFRKVNAAKDRTLNFGGTVAVEVLS